MTNLEKNAIKTCAERIKKLASLENASFAFNDVEKDKEIKNEIRPYMMWFDSVAEHLEEIIKLTDEKGYYKKHQLEEIVRLNSF